jgi:hypothetical protein
LKLRKSLYGIRQARRVFYQLVREHLINHGFLNIKSDTCIFTKVVNGNRIYIAVYVDDMLLFAKLLMDISSVKEILSQQFGLGDRQEVDFILGMKITRDREKKTIQISHDRYVTDLIEKCGLEGMKNSYYHLV